MPRFACAKQFFKELITSLALKFKNWHRDKLHFLLTRTAVFTVLVKEGRFLYLDANQLEWLHAKL